MRKKEGGLRPIAIGNVFRRLVGKIACFHVRNISTDYLLPHQVGVSAKSGCEAAIHATRTFIHEEQNVNKIVLKVDWRNAFNSVERDVILKEVRDKFPTIYPFLYQCYRDKTYLNFGMQNIWSEVGAQQGDPCGALIFSAAIHPIITKLKSEVNIWYLDDGTIAGEHDTVLKDLNFLIREAKEIGLEINPSKCELYFCSNTIVKNVLDQFKELAPDIKLTRKEDFTLLGAPLCDESFKSNIEKKTCKVLNLLERATKLTSHVAYTLLKNCLYVPKFSFLLRCSPFWKFPDVCENLDNALKSSFEIILNMNLKNNEWEQSCLPISKGGMGLRKIQDICLPAFLASVHSVDTLVSRILPPQDTKVNIHMYTEALDTWRNAYVTMPEVLDSQKSWDDVSVCNIMDTKIQLSTPEDSARIKALQRTESNAWLHAMPSTNVGTKLDDISFRFCVGLRLGCQLSYPHVCVCGQRVEGKGVHGLSCSKSAGRFSRHSELNQIIHRALSTIGFHSTLEPSGIFRNDGKRPDGMTLIPWSKGQHLVWDVTCVDTLAASYIQRTSQEAGAAAELASDKKTKKYEALTHQYCFYGLAVETLGPFSRQFKSLVDAISDKLQHTCGDTRAGAFLRQRLSLAVQRGNASSLVGTMCREKNDDMFVI